MEKRQSRIWTLGLVCLLFISGTPFTVSADSEKILPGFHPYLTVGEEYDSNIFLTNKDKIDDFITSINAGLKFSALEAQTYGIDLNFAAGYTYYARHHDFNYFSPSGALNAWYAATPRLTFRVREYLIRSDESREQTYLENRYTVLVYSANALPDQFLLSTVRGQRAIYIRNVAEPSVEYKFAKDGLISVLYRNNIYHNQNPQFEDSQENTINPKLTYGFNIRNGVTLDYYLTFGSYERSPDQMAQGARARYTYRFDPRTSIFGEYYFENQHFKSPGVDYNINNPSLGIEYKFSPTLSGVAQGGYFWENPDQGSKNKGASFNVGLTERAEKTTYALSFQGGYTEDYFTAQNLGFAKYYRAYGTINHRLSERMSAGFTGSLERPTYSDRKDWIWGILGNTSYVLLKWLTLSLEASYREDHSSIDKFNYNDFRGIFRVTASL